MKKFLYLILFAAAIVTACHYDNGEIGMSLDEKDVTMTVDTFYVYSANSDSVYSTAYDKVVNRSAYHMLGKIDVEGYADISADYLTEFRYIGRIDDTLVTRTMVDSLVLTIKFLKDNTIGDEDMPMQVSAYQLSRTLDSGSSDTLFTNVNPADYCDFDILLAERAFTSSSLGDMSSDDSVTDTDTVFVSMAITRDGLSSQEFAQAFYDYYMERDGFITQSEMDEYLPGLYINRSYGSGSITKIETTTIELYHKSYVYDVYYDLAEVDGEYKEVSLQTPILTSTQEVESVNIISADWSSEIDAIAASGSPIITTPLGYQANIILPIKKVVDIYNEKIDQPGIFGVVNSFNLMIPVVDTSDNDYDITPAPYLLLIRADGLQSEDGEDPEHITPNIFFKDKMMPDNVNTFIGSYSASDGGYTFVNMYEYISNIITYNPNESKQEYNYESDSHMILVPVDVLYDTDYTTITSIVPYIAKPTYTEIDTENIEVILVYTTKVY